MKMQYKRQLVGFCLLLALGLQSCNTNAQTWTKGGLIEDLLFLNNAVNAGHPITLNSAWSNNLDSIISEVEQGTSISIPAYDYENVLRKALRTIACAHTYILDSPLSNVYFEEIGANKYLPLRCFADSSGLYLLDFSSEMELEDIEIPVKITTINGVDAQLIIEQLMFYQPVDGQQKTLAYALINKFSHILLRRIFIDEDEININYISADGKTGNIDLKAVAEFASAEFQYYESNTAPIFSKDFIELHQLNQTTMYLQIKSMDYNDYRITNAEIFRQLSENGISNLIIDIRGNSGGRPESSFDLLSYTYSGTLTQIDLRPHGNVNEYLSSRLKLAGVWFWDKITPSKVTACGIEYYTNKSYPKKNQYTKNIFVLIDGFTSSSASFLAANLVHKSRAITIGQETAGGETGCNANSFQTLELPYSKTTINFPLFRFSHQLSIPDNHHGVRPMHRISYTAKEYLNSIDKEMEMVLKLIE
jgi:hypothetical protein